MWFKKNANTTMAKIQQGALVLYIPQAQIPSLWRMDLAQLHAAQFSIVDGTHGSSLLQCQIPDTAVQIIATFDDRAQAQMALNQILNALFKGAVGVSAVLGDAGTYVNQNWSIANIIKWFLLIVFTLLVLIVGRALFGDSTNAVAPPAAQKSATASATEQLEPGKPMNADDILQELDQ
jgi:hypothetical protein